MFIIYIYIYIHIVLGDWIPALAFKAPQTPSPDEMETQQFVDDLEKLMSEMNDDLMMGDDCDDSAPEVAVDPKVDGYRRQAAKDQSN